MTTAFLHFFDAHFLSLKLAGGYARQVAGEARLATRFAVVWSDEVLVPAASYFETDLCAEIINELRPVYQYGVVWLVGSGANVDEFIYRKLGQYSPESPQYARYARAKTMERPPFRTRLASATRDIRGGWVAHLDSGRLPAALFDGAQSARPRDFEKRWLRVPERLGDRAYVVEQVAPHLSRAPLDQVVGNRLRALINEDYFESYVDEFDAVTVGDLVYLASPHHVPSAGPPIPYRGLLTKSDETGLLPTVQRAPASELLKLRHDERWIACRASVTMGPATLAVAHIGDAPVPEVRGMEQLRCFIVHGHDHTTKLELKNYLQNTLGLPEPVILHQQPGRGRTVIEKFEESAEGADVAFVLLTPDDVGGLDAADLRERARQNVVFELGYFVGRFGRRSGRVIILYKGPLEIPSDLAGVAYVDVSGGVESRGEEIRKELQGLQRLPDHERCAAAYRS